MNLTWRVERARGSAAAFHEREMVEPAERAVWVFEVERPALVLGSTQSVDAVVSNPPLDVVRRRSGGGAVLVVPGESLWVDIVVPRGDPLWDDDVGRATYWLGAAWVSALSACGVDGATWHRGPLVRTPCSSLVCFAGLGPGEVIVGEGKAVGISQRRTRAGARFQCMVHRRWRPAQTLALLAEPRPGIGALGAVAEIAAVPEPLLSAFLHAIA